MNTVPLQASSLTCEIYETLRIAYLDASELIAHHDQGVSRKGRDIKKRVNQSLDYVRRIGGHPIFDDHAFANDDVSARQVLMRACMRDDIDLNNAVSINIDCDRNVVVRRHAAEISLVLRELCQNAIEALIRQQDPRLRVSLEAEESLVRIIVEDNGPGLPEETLNELVPTILPITRSIENRALGRGLPLAIRAARSIGAELVLMWTSRHGTVFSLTLSAEDFDLVANAPSKMSEQVLPVDLSAVAPTVPLRNTAS